MAKNKTSENSSAKFYASSINFDTDYSRDASYGIQREDSEIQRRNVAVIERLLREFDLEKTEQKHISKYIVEYAIDPNDYGSDR